MSDPTSPTTPDAAAPDALATWRVVLSCGDVGTCVPRDCEDGSWSAVVRWPDGAISRADGSDAGQSVYRAAVERCEWLYGRADDAAYVAEVLPPGVPSRAELTATLARLRAPADLAAIEARAAAASPRAVAYSYEGTTRGDPPRHQYSICNGTWQDEDTRPHKCIAMVYGDTEEDTADVVFFVNARHDVLSLLALLAAEREGRAAEVAGARAAECERWARHCDAIEASARARITHEDDDTDLRAEVTADTACSMARELRATLATKGAPDV